MQTTNELAQIAKRIRARDEAQDKDRKRQRELIRGMIAGGSTWTEAQDAAQVSRPTIMKALNRSD